MNYETAIVNLPQETELSGDRIRTPEEALGACKDLAFLAQESFHVLTLDTRNRLINRHMVSLGTMDSANVSVPLCFRCALGDAAVSLVVLHSHPSSDIAPSGEDIAVTKRLIETGKMIGIPVLDHIIVGRDRDTDEPLQLSLREHGLCVFE